MTDDSPAPRRNREAIAYGALLGLVLLAALSVPLLLAWGLLSLVRARVDVTRLEAACVLAVAVIGIAVNPAGLWNEYGTWLAALVGAGPGSRLDIPWLQLVSLTLLLASAWALIGTTRWGGMLGDKMLSARKSKAGGQILPTEKQKKAAEQVIVAAPGQALTIESVVHSPARESEPGRRRFPIGLDKSGQPVTVGEDEIRTHGLIFGSTGAGKSKTIEVIAGGLMDLGWDGMVLDLKEDAASGGLMHWCAQYADHHALPYQEFRISDPQPRFWFSPLHGMGPDEARDTIVASQQFEAAYYRALNEKQLGQLVTLSYAAHEIDPERYPAPNVYDIGRVLSAPDLPKATREMVAAVLSTSDEFEKGDFDALIAPDKAMSEAAGGLGARLTAMYQTKVGRTALRPGTGREVLDVTRPGLTYVGLSSGGMPEITSLVSAAVLRRVAVYAADRSTGKVPDRKPRFLIIDEANFVNRRLLLELLSRARGAGIAVIVCTQGPTDWESQAPGEPDLRSLVQNTTVSVIMRQGELTNAEICADIIGRAERSIVTQRFDQAGMLDAGSIAQKVDHLVAPDALRELGPGEIVIRVGAPSTWVSWAKVVVRDPRTSART